MYIKFLSFVLLLQNTDTLIMSSDHCTQIVPYNPPEIIKPFHEKTRQLFICGREWTLTQDWEQSGVAGVVWEAVSSSGSKKMSQLGEQQQVILEPPTQWGWVWGQLLLMLIQSCYMILTQPL